MSFLFAGPGCCCEPPGPVPVVCRLGGVVVSIPPTIHLYIPGCTTGTEIGVPSHCPVPTDLDLTYVAAGFAGAGWYACGTTATYLTGAGLLVSPGPPPISSCSMTAIIFFSCSQISPGNGSEVPFALTAYVPKIADYQCIAFDCPADFLTRPVVPGASFQPLDYPFQGSIASVSPLVINYSVGYTTVGCPGQITA